MKSEDRKAAIAAYKQRKTVAGIYAVRCAGSGEVWVGSTPNLDTIQNRIWFTLRLGTSPHSALQAAWTTHGAESFSFEALERMKDDEPVLLRGDWLKAHTVHWQETLGALAV